MIQIHFQAIHDICHSKCWRSRDSCSTVNQDRAAQWHGPICNITYIQYIKTYSVGYTHPGYSSRGLMHKIDLFQISLILLYFLFFFFTQTNKSISISMLVANNDVMQLGCKCRLMWGVGFRVPHQWSATPQGSKEAGHPAESRLLGYGGTGTGVEMKAVGNIGSHLVRTRCLGQTNHPVETNSGWKVRK